jgi:hypothetical protein
MENADSIFESELKRRGIVATKTAEGLYEFQVNDCKVSACLDNVRREYQRCRDPRVIVNFVDEATRDLFDTVPPWEDLRPFVRYCLEPYDCIAGTESVLHDKVTPDLCRVYAFTPPDGSRITWVDESMLRDWRVSCADLVSQANDNMDAIVDAASLECEEIDGVKLGMLSTSDTPFKASLILSPAFQRLVSATLGWPVYVVVPCRDFLYVLSKSDRQFLGRLGPVVVNEYRPSGHPITRDVLEVSDQGIKAIGTFPDSSR